MSDAKSPAFETALKHTLFREGGYVNDPADSGGETFRGISRVSWPKWPGWALIDGARGHSLGWADDINRRFAADEKMAALVADLYYQNFWRPFADLNDTPRLREKLFDTGVNCGIGQAVKLLQAAVNKRHGPAGLAVDGALGPKTKAAVKDLAVGVAEEFLLLTFVYGQIKFYLDIVARKPSQKKFLEGWLRRAVWLPE